MPSRFCIHYVSKCGRPSSAHRTEKGQSSTQSPRRVVLKNIQTTKQLHSSPMLVRLCSKSSELSFSIMWTENSQMFKLSLGMQRYQRSNCLHLLDHRESKRILGEKTKNRKHLTSVSLTMLKPLIVWIITKCYVKEKTVKEMGKLKKIWESQIILPVSWETCMWVKKQQIEPVMEQLVDSRSRKECNRAVCYHPVYFTYKLSTSWEMLG